MLREELIFAATCDFSGHVRGKGFPAADLPERLKRGLGWTPTNIMISALGPIWDTPFGTAGDLMLLPDPTTEVRIDFADGSVPEHFILSDLRLPDKTPWACCPREFLRRAIDALAAEGFSLCTAFEQEFVYTGADPIAASSYSLRAFRQQTLFASTLTAALRTAGLTPETFLAEYGPRQFEVTVAPASALTAADHAVIIRELVRATASRFGHRAIFSPVLEPDGTGNGVHLHLSLRDHSDRPVTYSASQPWHLSPAANHFFAGILTHLPALCAVTTPSPVSYLRLRPNRWAPTAADFARHDRSASLRLCPVFGPPDAADLPHQFNIEFRAADATASPYLALAAIIFAGVDGLQHKLQLPPDPELARSAATPQAANPLPRSLDAALDALESTPPARGWFGPLHFDAYLRAKRAEAANTRDLDPQTLCNRYAAAY